MIVSALTFVGVIVGMAILFSVLTTDVVELTRYWWTHRDR